MRKLTKAMYGKSMMKKGGSSKMKKYDAGGVVANDPGKRFKKRQEKKIEKAKTKATIAEIKGYGTVAQEKNNAAERAAMVLGTRRMKVPKSYTEGNISTSSTDNRNSGNTYNTTRSGADSGSYSGATGGQGGQGGKGGASSNQNTTKINSDNPETRQEQVMGDKKVNMDFSKNKRKTTSVNKTINKSIFKTGGAVKKVTKGCPPNCPSNNNQNITNINSNNPRTRQEQVMGDKKVNMDFSKNKTITKSVNKTIKPRPLLPSLFPSWKKTGGAVKKVTKVRAIRK